MGFAEWWDDLKKKVGIGDSKPAPKQQQSAPKKQSTQTTQKTTTTAVSKKTSSGSNASKSTVSLGSTSAAGEEEKTDDNDIRKFVIKSGTQKKKENEEFNKLKNEPNFIDYQRRFLTAKYNDNPKNVNEAEIKFINGETDEIPERTFTPEQTKKYYASINKTPLMNKEKVINEIKNTDKKNGVNYYDKTTQINQFTNDEAFKDTAVYNDELNGNDAKMLQKIKKDGWTKVMSRYNGQWAQMDIDEAIKYAKSNTLGRALQDYKYKGFKDAFVDQTLDNGKYALNALDTLGSGVRQAMWNANDGDDSTTRMGGLIDGMKWSLDGSYAKGYRDNVTGKELLTQQGWEGDGWGKKAAGFGLDVITGILPSSGGKTAIVKGGKFLAKSGKFDDAARDLEKHLMERVGKEAGDTGLKKATVARVMDQFRTNKGQISQTEVDDILKQVRQDSLQANQTLRQQGNLSNKNLEKAVESAQRKFNVAEVTQPNVTEDILSPAKANLTIRENAKTMDDFEREMMNTIRNGKTDAKFLEKFDKENGFWGQYLKDTLAGTVTRDKGLSYFGKELIDADTMKAMTPNMPNFVKNNALVEGFNSLFNKKYNVPKELQDELYRTQGQINFEQAERLKKLQDLLKPAKSGELKQLTAYMSGESKNLPTVFTQKMPDGRQLIDHIKDYRTASVNRERAFNPNMEELENYMPGIYKDNEKKIEKMLRQATGNPGSKSRTFVNYHQQKKFATPFDGQRAGLRPELDAGKLLFRREADSIALSQKKDLEKRVGELRKMRPELFNNFSEKYVDEFINPQNYKTPDGAIMSGIKGWNNFWRTAIMNTVPATGLRNLYGGIVNNSMDGVGAKDYWNAMKSGWFGKSSKLNGENVSSKDFIEAAVKNGIDNSQMKADVQGEWANATFGKKNLLKNLNLLDRNESILFKPGGAINNKVEELLRNARFAKGLDDYGLQGAKNAGDDVRKVHFDYNPSMSLTNAERTLREFIPFYTFQRFNLPYQLNRAVQSPTRFNVWANHLDRNMNTEENDPRTNPDTAGMVPEYLDNAWHVGDPNGDGKPDFIPTNWNSVNDLKSWYDPGKKITSSLSPIIKSLYDGFTPTDRQLGSGQIMNENEGRSPILGYEQAGELLDNMPMLGEWLGISRDPESGYVTQNSRINAVMNDFIPQLQNYTGIRRAFEKDESGKEPLKSNVARKALSLGTGLGYQDIDLMDQEKYARNDANYLADKVVQKYINQGKIDPEVDWNLGSKTIYEAEKEWFTEVEKYNKAVERITNGQLNNPYVGDVKNVPGYDMVDTYNDATYSVFGNPTALHLKYANPKGDFQTKYYPAMYKWVEDGLAQDQKDWQWYNTVQANGGKIPLKDFLDKYGIPY